MFEKLSGLSANQDKTAVYFRNMEENLKLDILRDNGFV